MSPLEPEPSAGGSPKAGGARHSSGSGYATRHSHAAAAAAASDGAPAAPKLATAERSALSRRASASERAAAAAPPPPPPHARGPGGDAAAALAEQQPGSPGGSSAGGYSGRGLYGKVLSYRRPSAAASSGAPAGAPGAPAPPGGSHLAAAPGGEAAGAAAPAPAASAAAPGEAGALMPTTAPGGDSSSAALLTLEALSGIPPAAGHARAVASILAAGGDGAATEPGSGSGARVGGLTLAAAQPALAAAAGQGLWCCHVLAAPEGDAEEQAAEARADSSEAPVPELVLADSLEPSGPAPLRVPSPAGEGGRASRGATPRGAAAWRPQHAAHAGGEAGSPPPRSSRSAAASPAPPAARASRAASPSPAAAEVPAAPAAPAVASSTPDAAAAGASASFGGSTWGSGGGAPPSPGGPLSELSALVSAAKLASLQSGRLEVLDGEVVQLQRLLLRVGQHIRGGAQATQLRELVSSFPSFARRQLLDDGSPASPASLAGGGAAAAKPPGAGPTPAGPLPDSPCVRGAGGAGAWQASPASPAAPRRAASPPPSPKVLTPEEAAQLMNLYRVRPHAPQRVLHRPPKLAGSPTRAAAPRPASPPSAGRPPRGEAADGAAWGPASAPGSLGGFRYSVVRSSLSSKGFRGARAAREDGAGTPPHGGASPGRARGGGGGWGPAPAGAGALAGGSPARRSRSASPAKRAGPVGSPGQLGYTPGARGRPGGASPDRLSGLRGPADRPGSAPLDCSAGEGLTLWKYPASRTLGLAGDAGAWDGHAAAGRAAAGSPPPPPRGAGGALGASYPRARSTSPCLGLHYLERWSVSSSLGASPKAAGGGGGAPTLADDAGFRAACKGQHVGAEAGARGPRVGGGACEDAAGAKLAARLSPIKDADSQQVDAAVAQLTACLRAHGVGLELSSAAAGAALAAERDGCAEAEWACGGGGPGGDAAWMAVVAEGLERLQLVMQDAVSAL
ncbi:hypothetical protein HT031_003892 [Scenedesmus sp. PABB004]|nr:hypothetical protein HT031_003892 [Scenedesmus sp. PABB004]